MGNAINGLKANGKLSIRLGWRGAWRKFEITGGPFDAYAPAPNSFGVCVRAERIHDLAFNVLLPVWDFEVPESPAMVAVVLKNALQAALDGKDVYVGCMGGWGRTGMFLALLAKVCGQNAPIGYVRQHYSPRAVETRAQARYVNDFDVAALRRWLFWASWGARVRRLY